MEIGTESPAVKLLTKNRVNFRSHIISARRGFTLIELVVAMAITSLIVVLLISILSIASDHWNRSRAEVKAERQAKALLDRMRGDLSAMVVPRWNPQEWFVAEFDEGTSGSGLPEDGGAAKLIFFTSPTDRYDGKPTDEQVRGDVSAVSYSVRHRDPVGNDGERFATRVMYRHLVNPDEAFENLLGKPVDQPDLAEAYRAFIPGEPRAEDFICENLMRYRIVFHVAMPDRENGGVRMQRVPLGAERGEAKNVRIREGELVFSMNGGESIPPGGKITAMEISVTILSDGAVQRLKTANFKDAAARDEFINVNSFKHSAVVEVPQS